MTEENKISDFIEQFDKLTDEEKEVIAYLIKSLLSKKE